MPKYTRTETINARKVTAAEGENIVTHAGVQHVPQGDYVVQTDSEHYTISADEFTAQGWKPSSKAKAKAKPAAKPDPTPKDKPLTPAQRIAAAKAAKAATAKPK